MEPNFENKTILTGVKPTGIPHLGNYVGAIKPAISLSRQASQSIMFIADYHALNQVHTAADLTSNSNVIASTFLSLGLDPVKTIFYRQADVPEIFELSVILSAVTPKGLMNRSHAYKAEMERNKAANKEEDVGINMGLFTYPILMSADILLFGTDLVPVGKDQIQHVEFARDIASYFNQYYGNVLKLPNHFVPAEAAAIPGLDGRKMSKSYNNTIPLFAEGNKLRKLIMSIVTDSKAPEEPKDASSSTIYQLYTQFASVEQVAKMKAAFENGGLGYGTAKKMLFEAADLYLSEPRRLFAEYMNNTDRIDEILAKGAERARSIASRNLAQIKHAAGIRSFDSQILNKAKKNMTFN